MLFHWKVQLCKLAYIISNYQTYKTNLHKSKLLSQNLQFIIDSCSKLVIEMKVLLLLTLSCTIMASQSLPNMKLSKNGKPLSRIGETKKSLSHR